MEIIDYSKKYVKPKNAAKHAPFFPRNIFAVIGGSTGSGKTNLIINFLRQEKVLDYHDVYIYSSTIYQSAYQDLKNHYNELKVT